MNARNILSTLFLTLFIFTCAAFSQVDKEQTFDVRKGGSVIVHINYGNIKYNVGSDDKLEVKAYNILPEEVKYLTMEKSGSKVVIKFRGEDSDDFGIRLTGPSKFNIAFETGGGNVKIEDDVEGAVTISTAGGNVSAATVIGKVIVSTAGGNIKLINVSDEVEVSTAGGDIKIGDVDGNAEVSTAGGNIKTGSINGNAKISTAGGNISVDKVNGDAKISTAGGNIQVGYVSSIAKINTAGGNIKIEGADGDVQLNTGAGNIKIINVKGSVQANTGAGNIYAEVLPAAEKLVELNTAIGNINIKVPPDLKATITARVNVMIWNDDENDFDQIKSDFEPVSIKRNKEEKKIIAVYKLNGGGSNIELNVRMGEIKIEKLK